VSPTPPVAPTSPPSLASHEEIVELLRQVTGEDREWSAGVAPATRLDGDLFLDSLELAALSALMAKRFGPSVDLAGHVAGLELEQLLSMTVADLVELSSA
jgi:acyl carrier protein